jgi:hypothetical protein
MPYGQGNYRRYQQGNYNFVSQNPYAAGTKRYGPLGRDYPTSGPVDKSGYRTRDAGAQNKRNAMLRKLKAQQKGKYASSDYLTPQVNEVPQLTSLSQMLGWYS